MCDSPPVVVEDPDNPAGGDGETEDPDKEDNGGTTDLNGGEGTDTNNGDESSLDPNSGRDNTITPEVIIIEGESEDNSSLQLILIILLCVLVPLIFILACIVHMFRKNKMNSVAAALARQQSSLRIEQDFNEKMEGKKNPDIFADDEKNGTAAKNGMIPDDAEKMVGVLTQVPTDEEIKELLKGKSGPEKKKLLKEIEKARQQKIHLEYLLEMTKNKNDEKWAVRNVEERHAILNLYNNVDEASTTQNKMLSGDQSKMHEARVDAQQHRDQGADITGAPENHQKEVEMHTVSPQYAGSRDEEPQVHQP